jgi:hypothetical protein
MEHCPECGADGSDGQTCADHFNTLGFWEMDHGLLEVHHLLVLCFHLQHPSRYSPDGLAAAKKLLVIFLEEEQTPQGVRKRLGKTVDSSQRRYKITGTPDSYGRYAHPVPWKLTVADVVRAGMDQYYDSVRAWADSILTALRASENLGEG